MVALAILGVYGLGPTVAKSALGSFFWMDNGENLSHLVIGVGFILAYNFLKETQITRWLVILVGVVALLAALIGFVTAGDTTTVGGNFYGLANLENPADTALNLVIGGWAFYAAFGGEDTETVA